VTETWALAALWLGLALIATLLSIWLRVATALSEMILSNWMSPSARTCVPPHSSTE